MGKLNTAERVSREASDNFVFQRSLLAYHAAAERIAGFGKAEGGENGPAAGLGAGQSAPRCCKADSERGADVLEIGTGSGYGIEVIAPRARRFVTIDKHTPAKELLGGPNVEFRRAVVPPLPFADESFDFVISFQVIEHIRHDRAFVREVQRVLRRGGRFIVSTPNAPMSLTRNPWHVREYTAAQLEGLLKGEFRAVEALGIAGNACVMAYYARNRQGVARITRFDIFDLQHRLPRWMLQLPYDLLNRLNRRKLLREAPEQTTSIRMEDYTLGPVSAESFDLFFIAEK